MLILTRRPGEAIMIDDNIQIRVLEMKGYQVRLGIDAPKTIEVHRQEIYDRIQGEKVRQKQYNIEVSND